uniref:Uncharacterized protein n=1 Tax=Romanomermis culicivorax TaxID=13658 RepID=A0A915KZA9_ROMCU
MPRALDYEIELESTECSIDAEYIESGHRNHLNYELLQTESVFPVARLLQLIKPRVTGIGCVSSQKIIRIRRKNALVFLDVILTNKS